MHWAGLSPLRLTSGSVCFVLSRFFPSGTRLKRRFKPLNHPVVIAQELAAGDCELLGIVGSGGLAFAVGRTAA